MKRLSILFLACLTPLVLAWSAGAEAQSCTNGRALYKKKLNNVDVSCSQSSCHSSDVTADKNNIWKGASNAQAIDIALDGVTEMAGLRSFLGLTTTDLDDIALYLFYASNGLACPAAAPAVSASPTSLSFGNINTGSSSAPQVITVSNTGTGGATGMAYPAAPSGYSRSTTCAATLAAGASCTISFTFSPAGAGSANANWTITGDSGISVPVSLTGTGVAAAPNLGAAPPSVSFGSVNVGQTSPGTNVTITNNGAGGATGVGFINSNAAEFLVSGNTCGATLASGASCGLSIAYKPTAAGADNAMLTVNYTGGPAVVINLSGSGAAVITPANLVAAPPTLAFGSVTSGTTGGKQTVTVSNSGGTAATGIALAGSNPAEFVVSANTCAASLGAGASCTLDLAYAPSAPGADSAALTINYSGGSAVVTLTGTGSTAPVANLLATPGNAAFGSVTVGLPSATVPFTLSNTGNAVAAGIAFANTNAAEFVVNSNTCGTTLAAGASCAFNMTYSPTAMGADNATLTISYTGGASMVLPLSGTGVTAAPPPAGQLSLPVALTMPDQQVGTTGAPVAVQVSNIGSAAVTVSAITLSNMAEFALAGSTCASVAAGATCTLSFTFTPSGTGGRSTSVNIVSNGTGSPQTLVVQGTGLSAGGTPPPPTSGTAEAIEYFHAGFGHYFITAIADEITKIDNGTFKG